MKYLLFLLIIAIIYRILQQRAQARFDAQQRVHAEQQNRLYQTQFQQETDALNPHLKRRK